MKKNWTQSGHCSSRAHCVACRGSESFRQSILDSGFTEKRDFDCPHGVPWDYSGRILIGDTVARLAKPIARAADRVLGTNLKNCEGCKKRQARLNRLGS